MLETPFTRLLAQQRFGFGARGSSPGRQIVTREQVLDELERVRSTEPAPPTNGLPTTAAGLELLIARQQFYLDRSRSLRNGAATGAMMPESSAGVVGAGVVLDRELESWLNRAVHSPFTLPDRLSMHWQDHFTAATKFSGYFGGGMEREAIRRHFLGPFRSLLVACVLHPAMLFYLDNRTSVGPNSPVGLRSRGRRGLNENLGREALELHSLGADGGYTQDDVTALAKVLTGWSVDIGEVPRGPDRFGFFPDFHEPGPKSILGKTYPQDGPDQALAVLNDLASHPATARNVTRRMVRHIVGHGLPGLEARMERVFRHTDGDLGAVTRALILDDEAWGPSRKMRSPMEFTFATARLLGGLPAQLPLARALRAMGQPFWAAPSPKGWPSENDAWAAPDSIKTRLDWASEVATHVGADVDARALLDTAFGPAASPETRQAVARASNGRQALTLLLMSPEFQRR